MNEIDCFFNEENLSVFLLKLKKFETGFYQQANLFFLNYTGLKGLIFPTQRNEIFLTFSYAALKKSSLLANLEFRTFENHFQFLNSCQGFSRLIMPSEEIHSSTLRVKISVCLEHNKSNQDKTPTFQKNLEKVTNLYDKINACTYNQKTKLI